MTPLSLFDVRVYTRTPKYAFASVNLDDGTYADTERFWYDLEGNMIDFEIALSTIRAQDQVLATEERALANLDRVFGNWFQG